MRACNCPNCNASLSFNDDRDFGFCEYCGTKIMLDDYRTTQRIVDEAKIKQAEVEKEIRFRELEIEEARLNQQLRANSFSSKLNKTITTIWLIISVILIAITVYLMLSPETKESFDWFIFLGYACCPVIGGGGYLVFKVIPSKEADRHALQAGGIRFPKSLEPFTEKDFETVQATLRSAGFTNITCTNLHDVRLGLLQKPNKVTSISVNGENITSGGKVYMPNAIINITHHGYKN